MPTIKSIILYMHSKEAGLLKLLISSTYRRMSWFEWNLRPKPSFYDHDADLYYGWKKSRNPMWLERGFFNLMVLKGGRVFEISCGDGFNTRNFYSLKSMHIDAIDLCQDAIRLAKRKNHAPNIQYTQGDIRNGISEKNYENIIWDFGYPFLEFFSIIELKTIFEFVKGSLATGGIFSGSTQPFNVPIEKNIQDESDGRKYLTQILLSHFSYCAVFETKYEERNNLYFWASDSPGALPITHVMSN